MGSKIYGCGMFLYVYVLLLRYDRRGLDLLARLRGRRGKARLREVERARKVIVFYLQGR